MMNCKDSRMAIALDAGGDLDDSSVQELCRHLASCPSCRDHRSSMKSAMSGLSLVDDSSTSANHESLWPSLSTKLGNRGGQFQTRRFNGWVAALSMAALVMAAVSISRQLPTVYRPQQVYNPQSVNFTLDSVPQQQTMPEWVRPSQDSLQAIPVDTRGFERQQPLILPGRKYR